MLYNKNYDYEKKYLFFYIIFISVYYLLTIKKRKSNVNINGSIDLHYDVYSYSEENFSTFRPRYPESLFRFNANLNIQLEEHFSFSIRLNITNHSTITNKTQRILNYYNLF